MRDGSALGAVGRRLRRRPDARSIYGMDIRVSRYGDAHAPAVPLSRQLARSTSVPVPENRRPSSVAVTLSSLMVDGIPSIVRS